MNGVEPDRVKQKGEWKPPDADSIRRAGMAAVVDYLRKMGYLDIESEVLYRDLENITATKGDRRLMVCVRSSLYPEDPGFLSVEEKKKLMDRASAKGAEPKLARVWLNRDLTLKDRYVMWTGL